MSKLFVPKIEKPKPVKEKPLTQVQDRGRIGRTILAGANAQDDVGTKKKSILGG